LRPPDCPIFLVENDGEHGERARARGQRVTLPSCAAASEPSPMPIRQYLEGHRFDAETVRLMGVAVAMAVVTLQQRRRIDPLRDSVAHKIIDATNGSCVNQRPRRASRLTALGRHNKATARDDYPTASRLGIIKPPWPQGRGRPRFPTNRGLSLFGPFARVADLGPIRIAHSPELGRSPF